MILQKYTALKIILLLTLGVISGILISDLFISLIFSFILFLVILFLYKFRTKNFYSLLWISVGLVISNQINDINLLSTNTEFSNNCFAEGQIVKKIYNDSLRELFLFEGDIYLKETKKEYAGNAILIIKSSENKITPGNKVLLSGNVELVKNYSLPTERAAVFSALSENIKFQISTDISMIKITDFNKNFNFYLDQIRAYIFSKIKEYTPKEIINYAYSVISGDLSLIPKEEKKLYSLTGTIHILNVSGLHVALFSFVIFELLWLLKNKKIKFALFTISISLFILLTGLQPPGVRAGIVSILVYLVYLSERRINMLNLILFSAVFFFLVNPNIIFSVSFQLSFAATISIVIFYPILYEKLKLDSLWLKKHYIIKSVLTSVIASFSAGILLNPLIGFYFGIFSVISFISNIIIVPLYNLFIIFTFLGLIFSLFSTLLAGYFAFSSLIALNLIKWLLNVFVNIDYSYFFSENLFKFELLISFGIILLIISKKVKLLIFRFCYLSIFIIIFYLNFYKEPVINQYYRKNYSIIKSTEYKNQSIIYINEKEPFLYTKGDKKAIEFFKDFINSDSLLILWNGNNGMLIRDALKQKFKLNDIYLNQNQSIYLTNLFKNYEKY